MNVKTVQREIGGQTLTIETGKMARLADGAVTVRYGDTVVLVTAAKKALDEYPGFLPLTVEYREKTSSIGKVPGGFLKREGRPSTKEILTMRLIDRSLRPLFPSKYNAEVQIIAFVISSDQENDADIPAMIGASSAALLGGIPVEPIVGVRVGRINGEFVLNPTHTRLSESDMNLVVSGTKEAIVMVEGGTQEASESDVIDALLWSHEHIKNILAMQQELLQGLAPAAEPIPEVPVNEFESLIANRFGKDIEAKVQTQKKKERQEEMKKIYDAAKEALVNEEAEDNQAALFDQAFDANVKRNVRSLIQKGKRVDGRGLKDIRKITCEVGLLPRTHGSALFTRGETQALVSTTLGTSSDEQIIEGLIPQDRKKFMLHYNFPPFCVGEVRRIMGVSRREVGHGSLAETAIKAVLPDETRFPYTLRIVSDILESNGSSSMASVCGGTLSLMDAGVPIRKPVAGIAMGLVKEGSNCFVLSDISGTEDHYGDMDFKVAGTQHGITALQMDIKIKGVSRKVLTDALEQAREGRISILREMMKVISRPNRDISEYAPKIIKIQVPSDKIAAIIGPGGKNIRGMQASTGATIEVNDEGIVMIYCRERTGAEKAEELIRQVTEEVEIGKIYTGKVTSVKDFGAFVEILPGTEGLIHVSELEKTYVQNVGDVIKIGDEVTVKVLAVDDQNRIKLSKKAVDSDGEGSEATEAPTDLGPVTSESVPRSSSGSSSSSSSSSGGHRSRGRSGNHRGHHRGGYNNRRGNNNNRSRNNRR